MATGFVYTAVSKDSVALGVRANGMWWNFAVGNWSTPFNASIHILPLSADASFPAIQVGTIPMAALIGDACIIEFSSTGGVYSPVYSIGIPADFSVGDIPALIATPSLSAYRDEDILDAAAVALEVLSVFDQVYTYRPDRSQSAEQQNIAYIQIVSHSDFTEWDSHIEGSAIVDLELSVMVSVRNEDHKLRDRRVGQLGNSVRNALNGSTLGGLLMPAFSLASQTKLLPETPPERIGVVPFSCRYLVDTVQSYDTSD